MDTIVNNIIFNTLSSKQGVFLPDIGSLWIEYVSAEVLEGKTISAPANRVGFSPDAKDGMPSIIDKIEAVGIDTSTAKDMYRRWFEKSKTLQGVNIAGTGELRDGLFIPSEELSAFLNPRIETEKLKEPNETGLSKAEKNWLILIVIFIIILAVGWSLRIKHKRADDEQQATRSTVVASTPSAQPSATPPDSTPDIAETTAETIVISTEKSETEANTASQTFVVTSGTVYHVVGGVFSTQANADKFISDHKKKYPNLDYQKHDFKGNKIMVSLFSSSNNNEVQTKKNELVNLTGAHDLWIYKAK